MVYTNQLTYGQRPNLKALGFFKQVQRTHSGCVARGWSHTDCYRYKMGHYVIQETSFIVQGFSRIQMK